MSRDRDGHKSRRSRSKRRDRSTSGFRHRERSISATRCIREIASSFTETLERLSRASQQSSDNRKVNMREPKNVIPNYDPRDTHQTIEKWIEKIEGLKTQHR